MRHIFFLLILVGFFGCKSENTNKFNNEKAQKAIIGKKIETLINDIGPSSLFIEKGESNVFKPFNLPSFSGKNNDIEKYVRISDTLLRLLRNQEETINKDLVDLTGEYNFYKPKKNNIRDLYFGDFDRSSLINFCNLLHYNYFTSLIFSNASTIYLNGSVENRFSEESIQKAKLFLDETISNSKHWPLSWSMGKLTPFKIIWKEKAETVINLYGKKLKSETLLKDYGNNFYVNIPFKMMDVRIKNFDYSTVKKLLSYEGVMDSLIIKVNVLETYGEIFPSLKDMAENGLSIYITDNKVINISKKYNGLKIDDVRGLRQNTVNKFNDSSNYEVTRESLLFKEFNKYWDITFEYPKDIFIYELITEKIIKTLHFSD